MSPHNMLRIDHLFTTVTASAVLPHPESKAAGVHQAMLMRQKLSRWKVKSRRRRTAYTISATISYKRIASCDGFTVKVSPGNRASDLMITVKKSLGRKEEKDSEDASEC
ncbi:MAG: hypothetical protein Q9212_006151 [Teloschistes hypoglaucus]